MRKMVINLNVKPRIDSRGYTIINNNRCAQCRGQDYAMGVKYKWNYKFLHFLSSLMLNAHIVNEPYMYPLQWKRKKKQSKGGFKHLKPPLAKPLNVRIIHTMHPEKSLSRNDEIRKWFQPYYECLITSIYRYNNSKKRKNRLYIVIESQ